MTLALICAKKFLWKDSQENLPGVSDFLHQHAALELMAGRDPGRKAHVEKDISSHVPQTLLPDPFSSLPLVWVIFFPLWAQFPRFLFKDLMKWKLQKFSVNSNVYIKARRWYFNISLILSIPISFLHFNVSELSYAINLMCICSVTAFIFAPKSLTKLVLLLTTHNILQSKK